MTTPQTPSNPCSRKSFDSSTTSSNPRAISTRSFRSKKNSGGLIPLPPWGSSSDNDLLSGSKQANHQLVAFIRHFSHAMRQYYGPINPARMIVDDFLAILSPRDLVILARTANITRTRNQSRCLQRWLGPRQSQ